MNKRQAKRKYVAKHERLTRAFKRMAGFFRYYVSPRFLKRRGRPTRKMYRIPRAKMVVQNE